MKIMDFILSYGSLKSISKYFYELNSINRSIEILYLSTARSKFVLSPLGDEGDCYHTWKALYLGSISIVLDTTINSIFQQLPVLIINNYERLYKGYWQNRINSFPNYFIVRH